MAQQDIIPGSKFRLLRQNDTTPSQYDFMCMATTKSLDRKTDFEDATFPDCDNPDALAKRRSSPKSQSWDMKFSGKADALRFAKIEADFDSGVTHSYQLLIALTSAKGGRTYTGTAYIESLTISSSDNGMVAFDCALRGDGLLVSAAVA